MTSNIFMWLLQNGAAAGRFLRLITLLPALIPLVQIFEKRSDLSGPDKRQAVLDTLDLMTNVLEKRGYITSEINKGMDQVAGDIIDLLVATFKAAGIFQSNLDAIPAAAAAAPAVVVVVVEPSAVEHPAPHGDI